MGNITNDFAWSKSRAGMFNTCARQYYMRYYGSWNGWKKGIDERTRSLYVLGKLQNRFSWAGSVVHDFAEVVLKRAKNGEPLPTEKEAEDYILKTMRAGFRNSRSKNYLKFPKSVGLTEHEYEENVAPEKWKEMSEKAVFCAKNLLKSPYMKPFFKNPKDWLEIEDLSEVTIDGIKCWVKMDFCGKLDDKIHIIDFKTGKPNPKATKDQLTMYAVYAQERWKKKPEDIVLTDLNLATNEATEYAITQKDIDRIIDMVIKSAGEMTGLLADDEKNEPFEEDMYPGTKNKRDCYYCVYRKVCSVKLT